jgi:hypothetical protein
MRLNDRSPGQVLQPDLLDGEILSPKPACDDGRRRILVGLVCFWFVSAFALLFIRYGWTSSVGGFAPLVWLYAKRRWVALGKGQATPSQASKGKAQSRI